jgi:ribosomal protein S6--L-glutamate ligase
MTNLIKQTILRSMTPTDKKPVIGILTTFRREEDYPSTKRLMQEAEKAGIRVKRFDPTSIALMTDAKGLHFFYKGQKKDKIPFDILIPRISSKPNPQDNYAALLDGKHFEAMGVTVLNSANAIENAEDKFVSHQLLAKAKLPQPRSLYSPYPGEVEELKHLKGDTLVQKTIRGCKGMGIEFLNRRRVSSTISGENFAQELADVEIGTDYRYLVIHGKVVAAMKRSAADGGYLSNASLGGDVHAVPLDPEMSDIAVKAAKALNLEIAGVDLMKSKKGPVVIEVNSTPGFTGLERATGKNIAAEIIAAAVDKFASISTQSTVLDKTA